MNGKARLHKVVDAVGDRRTNAVPENGETSADFVAEEQMEDTRLAHWGSVHRLRRFGCHVGRLQQIPCHQNAGILEARLTATMLCYSHLITCGRMSCRGCSNAGYEKRRSCHD